MAVEKLREGKRIIGTMVRMIKNPVVALVAKDAGLDFIMIDMEHGSYSVETFSAIASVARGVGLGIFVRVPELSKGYVSGVLDGGANGVMVPMVSTEEQARALVNWSRYAPVGKRGLGSPGGHTDFGVMRDDPDTFMARQNELSLAIAQIETKEAIENIDAIGAVDGIDVLLVGPNDLSNALGVTGELMSDIVQQAIGKVADAALKHGKVFAIHSGDALLDKWESRGMQMIMNNLEINILASGFSTIAKKYKGSHQ
jgi:4-hydroxy-2-oxoheptanedioate aldolase